MVREFLSTVIGAALTTVFIFSVGYLLMSLFVSIECRGYGKLSGNETKSSWGRCYVLDEGEWVQFNVYTGQSLEVIRR